MAGRQPTSDDPQVVADQLFRAPWGFLKGVVGIEHLPGTTRKEVAFAGRSNVGKSSLINAVLRQKGLARTSNTPGRTQEINFFSSRDGSLYVVDLPGYGFAQAPKSKVDSWTRLVTDYLRGRPSLGRVFLLIDARHGVKAVDEATLAMLDMAAVSTQAVLTKADKINAFELKDMVALTEAAMKRHPAAFPQVLVTSSETGAGLDDVRAAIAAIVIG